MKRSVTQFITLFTLAGVVFGVDRGINWSSEFLQTNLLSDGVTTIDDAQLASPDTHTFTFELGQFNSSFTPTRDNVDEWQANWNSLDSTTYNTLDQNFAGAANLSDNTTFGAGTQAYIWGYNNQNVGGDSEWILLADPTWRFPLVDDQANPDITWVAGLDTDSSSALLGELNGNGFLMQTEQPVPEPSTVLLSALAAASLILRRRR